MLVTLAIFDCYVGNKTPPIFCEQRITHRQKKSSEKVINIRTLVSCYPDSYQEDMSLNNN